MAYSLMMEHDVLLILHERSVEGLRKVQESLLPYVVIHDDAEIDRIIADYRPDIWVNDCLNTDEEYILHLKEQIPRVVTIEDLGTGSEVADAAVNALYIEAGRADHIYSGYEYVCLREEFQIEQPRAFSEEVRSRLGELGVRGDLLEEGGGAVGNVLEPELELLPTGAGDISVDEVVE